MYNFKLPHIYNDFIPKQIQKPPSGQQIKTLSPINQDLFQKSIQGAACVQACWSNEKIQTIFDKTFNIVLAQNPIVNQLNYKKPDLNFTHEQDENSRDIATYGIVTNEIQIKNPNFFNEDLYLLKYYDNANNLCDIRILPKKEVECVNMSDKDYRITKTKLTEPEKELYISSVFAHELRHSIQDHIRLSTKNCNRQIIESIQYLKNSYLQIIELNNQLLQLVEDSAKKKEIEQETEEYKRTLEKIDYSLNYQPRQWFDKDMTLKFSLNPNDNRYLSIQKHFNSTNKSQMAYENQPCEVDAYNYQGEFIITQTPKTPSNDLRAEIINDMSLAALIQANSQTIFDKN